MLFEERAANVLIETVSEILIHTIETLVEDI
jgi:hypothetical protein